MKSTRTVYGQTVDGKTGGQTAPCHNTSVFFSKRAYKNTKKFSLFQAQISLNAIFPGHNCWYFNIYKDKGLGSIRGYFGLNILGKLNTFV